MLLSKEMSNIYTKFSIGRKALSSKLQISKFKVARVVNLKLVFTD